MPKYQLQVLGLQFNYLMLMKASEGVVKIQPDDNFLKWSNLDGGPFKIEHGSGDKKFIFVPTQGNWTNFENAKYAAYIVANKKKMEGRPQIKLWQLHKEMSLFIQTRNFRQCKTHHQRLTQISANFTGIVNYLRSTIVDFDSLLTIQMQSYKNFRAQKSEIQLPVENPPVRPASETEISPIDKKQTAISTTDEYLPQQMKAFPPMLNQSILGSGFPLYMPPFQTVKSNAQEWLECHSLFLQWTKKLQQLNSMSFHY